MLDIREIPLGPFMTKYHFEQAGIPAMHRINADPHGDPHDHPFAMTSMVLYGGYTEEIFDPVSGKSQFLTHKRDDGNVIHGYPASTAFLIPAKRIHRIVETLGNEECWTITLPHAWEQREGIWQWREDGAYKLTFGEQEWIKQ